MFGLNKEKRLDWHNAYSRHKIQKHDPVWIRQKKSKLYILLRVIIFGVLIFFLIFIIFIVFNINTIRLFHSQISAGKNNIELSFQKISHGEFYTGAEYAGYAEANFAYAAEVADTYRNNFIVRNSDFLSTEQSRLYRIVKSASILSKTGKKLALFAAESGMLTGKNKLNFTSLSANEKANVLKYLHESMPELTGIKANLDLVICNFSDFEDTILFWPLRGTIRNISNELVAFRQGLSDMIPVAKIAPQIMGYPNEKNYLLIMQNTDELRPTGGFIGTYGILSTENGEIKRSDTHDIYHMDMPVKDKLNVEPPEPLRRYLNADKWFMRDSNWSPDWAESAKKIEWFYHQENPLLPPKDDINDFEDEFDGVIAITPGLVMDLLSVTGAIEINGERYNENNFQDLLQYKVEQGYIQEGISSWHRKEVIGDILKELKKRMFASSVSEYRQLFAILLNNLEKKNILLYFKDDYPSEVAEQMNWSGRIHNTSGDYVMVVDSNMASLKTDAVIERRIKYQMDRDVRESRSRLTVEYRHNGDFDWKTTRYRTYTRIYIPKESRVADVRGFQETLAGDDAYIYDQFGYKVISGLFVVEPGETGYIELDYYLPDEIHNSAKHQGYDLYIQKQPGKKLDECEVSVSFTKPITDFRPRDTEFIQSSTDKLLWRDKSLSDTQYTVRSISN